MKYFIFSDVHSYYSLLMSALNDAGFDIDNPEHRIISLGDLCDRGDDPVSCLKFVNKMYKDGRAILVRGNHEDLMEEAIARKEFWAHDIHNCTDETVFAIVDPKGELISDYDALEKMKRNRLWNTYIKHTIDYAEIGDNIFVHGWIPASFEYDEGYDHLPLIYRPTHDVYDPNWRNTTWVENWNDARWKNGMKMWNKGIREPGKTIWCGHYHTSWGHSYLHNDGEEWLNKIETCYIDPDTGKQEPHCRHDPFEDDGIVAMDACTAISNIVNVKVLEV